MKKIWPFFSQTSSSEKQWSLATHDHHLVAIATCVATEACRLATGLVAVSLDVCKPLGEWSSKNTCPDEGHLALYTKSSWTYLSAICSVTPHVKAEGNMCTVIQQKKLHQLDLIFLLYSKVKKLEHIFRYQILQPACFTLIFKFNFNTIFFNIMVF